MSNEEVYSLLIVDDSYEDRYLLKRMLSKVDLQLLVLEADGGQSAIDLITTPIAELENTYPGIRAPLALFLDINMPGMNGWDFLEQLGKSEDALQLKPTVVVMYSTSDAVDEMSKAKTYPQVVDYIVKGDQTPEMIKQAILACTSEYRS